MYTLCGHYHSSHKNYPFGQIIIFPLQYLGYGQQFNTTLKLITKLLRGIFAPYAKKAGIDI